MKYRGPDYTAFKYYDDKLLLGHNRLSIIDLDARSNQPFEYEHLSVVYNGEVYNFREIRSALEKQGYRFTTSSDTEVIAAAYLAYGRECVEQFNGMFAFVIYDKKQHILFGARDRTGQKPLYYTLREGHLEFASQPGPIAISNRFSLDEQAVSQFYRWGYIPEPRSIFQEVKKLRTGHFFTYDLTKGAFREEKYWDIPRQGEFIDFSFDAAKEALHDLLKDAVQKRLIADVPLGVFLSGGIDSSLVAALAQSLSDEPVRTFTVKFEEEVFDESPFAKQVAEQLQTKHTEIHCNPQEGIGLIEDMYKYYDEPFADSSAIPSLLLAKHTRKYVKVALTGDAGDENFLGYKRYDRILRLEKLFTLPQGLRNLLALALAFSPKRLHRERTAKGMRVRDINELYYKKLARLDDGWMENTKLGYFPDYYHFLSSSKPLLERISDFDIKTYLVEDVNTKMDRATMAFSLEGRSPLLDYRVIEMARSFPTAFKYKDGIKKHILKEILYEYVPAAVFDRPKKGFSMPFRLWFKNRLKDYVLDTITETNLKDIPNIRPRKVLNLTHRHIQGKEDNYNMIWSMLVMINWMKNNGGYPAKVSRERYFEVF